MYINIYWQYPGRGGKEGYYRHNNLPSMQAQKIVNRQRKLTSYKSVPYVRDILVSTKQREGTVQYSTYILKFIIIYKVQYTLVTSSNSVPYVHPLYGTAGALIN